MSEPIKYRILFCLHKHDKKMDPQLQCRVKWNSSKCMVTLNTGYRVDPDRWDVQSQRCRPNSFHGSRRIPGATINAEILRYTDAVEQLFSEFSAKNLFPSTADVKAGLQAKLSYQEEQKDENVFLHFEQFCIEQGNKNAWSDSTYMKWHVFRNHLMNWKPDLKWSDFDENGLTSFIKYLREDRNHKNSTIKKLLSFLRWFLAWADQKNLLVTTDYRTFKPKFKGQEQRRVIFLTWDELMSLWAWDATEKPLHGQVRDIFCFCCFTSLRYSDAVNLRWSDVKEDSIVITAVKTAEPLEIQLNKWSRELLWKYVDESQPDDRVFPYISNQVVNRYLHEICKDCGINTPIHTTWYRGSERHDEVHQKWELVSSHCGRRTFICNALAMGISPTIVMQWTGHSDYESMKPYIGVAQDTKAAAMALFEKK